MAAHIKIKLTRGIKFVYYIARKTELPPYLYYFQFYLRSLPNQLIEQQNTFFERLQITEVHSEGVDRKWVLCDLNFGILSIVLKKAPNMLSAQFYCFGVGFHFKGHQVLKWLGM